jgi:hypothetical protein
MSSNKGRDYLDGMWRVYLMNKIFFFYIFIFLIDDYDRDHHSSKRGK